jgi:hypothetical protein
MLVKFEGMANNAAVWVQSVHVTHIAQVGNGVVVISLVDGATVTLDNTALDEVAARLNVEGR